MSATTMLDMGGLAFLDGDPLGLRDLDESLAWNANGPLPDWLDGTDDEDEDDCDLNPPAARCLRPPTPVPHHSDRPAPSHIEPPLIAELVDTGPPTTIPEPADDDLVSIEDLFRDTDEPSTPPIVAEQAASPPVAEPKREPIVSVAARRFLSFDELIDARLCLLAVVADRLWAIPFDRVVHVTSRPTDGRAVDVFERQEGRKRRTNGVTIGFDTDVAVIVDRILGPRTLAWEPPAANSDCPAWMIAQVDVAGETVGLLDWESLCSPE